MGASGNGGTGKDGKGEMSKRAHFWLRLSAAAVIAAAHWLPRATNNVAASTSTHGAAQADAPMFHASVAAR